MPSWEPAATAAFLRHTQRYGTRRLRASRLLPRGGAFASLEEARVLVQAAITRWGYLQCWCRLGPTHRICSYFRPTPATGGHLFVI